MEAQDTGRQGNAGRVAGTALLVFLLVYFLYPVAFIWPFYIAYGPHAVPPPRGAKFLNVFPWPDNYVYDRVPLYHQMVEKEFRWTGIR